MIEIKIPSKKAMSSQIIFTLFMAIMFIAILIYGYNALFTIQSDLSDKELQELRSQIISKTDICSNSLQKGRVDTIEVDNSKITHVCIVNSMSSSDMDVNVKQVLEERGIFQENTIVLLSGPTSITFNQFTNPSAFQEVVDEFLIYDIIPLNDGVEISSPFNGCIVQENSVVNFKFTC